MYPNIGLLVGIIILSLSLTHTHTHAHAHTHAHTHAHAHAHTHTHTHFILLQSVFLRKQQLKIQSLGILPTQILWIPFLNVLNK